jgi:hypothetical protein
VFERAARQLQLSRSTYLLADSLEIKSSDVSSSFEIDGQKCCPQRRVILVVYALQHALDLQHKRAQVVFGQIKPGDSKRKDNSLEGRKKKGRISV